MAFTGIKLFETEAEEAARLSAAPEGSTSHTMSLLPVTIPFIENHQLIELPVHPDLAEAGPCTSTVFGLAHKCDGRHRIVVLPLQDRDAKGSADKPLPRRHDHSWTVRVVASDHPSYSAGGHDLCVDEASLRRGKLIEI